MSGVIVVGAGPAGLVAACELATRGVAVRVVDKLASPTDQSRAIVVHARSLEMFERMGIARDVIDSGVKTVAMQMFAPSGHRVAKVDLDHVDSAFPYSVTTPQTETERILTRRLEVLGGQVERGIELTGLSQDEGAVHLTLRHADGTTERTDASYVIGADGSHSTVRDQIGVHLAGSFEGERLMQDAFNLAWKLALALAASRDGGGQERLLNSYQEERHPVAAKVIEFSNVLTNIGTVRGELATAIRDHAVQLAVALAPVRHAIATQTEEVALGCRHSSIVFPTHHRHGARSTPATTYHRCPTPTSRLV
jgi:2-polyprenyl-6-methoxyphenol hydroxylase-like FAD-dependent oxidoreductase